MAARSGLKTLTLLCALASFLPRTYASSSPQPGSGILHILSARGPVSCKDVDSNLPSDFTCQADRQCISVDSSSTAVCCPSAFNCTTIKTIDCNIQLQDPTAHPTAAVFTTRLNDTLPTCGSNCCPFGYNCVTSGGSEPVCSIILGTSRFNNSTPTTASSLSSTSTTPTSTPTSTTLSSGIDSSTPQTQTKCNKFPAGVFMAGFFPGIVIGAFTMLGWVICSGRHRKPASRESADSSIYAHKMVISDPIPMMSGGARTDFLRRTTTRAKSIFSAKGSPRTDSNPWKMPTPPVPNNIPAQPLGLPVTPQNKVVHQPSTESIKVYSPQSIAQPSSAAVAPLRGMTSQRKLSNAGFGSPFKTPPNANVNVNTSKENAILTPQRYEGGGRVRDEDERYDARARPETTFTDFMLNTGFEKAGQRPVMPPVPKGYDAKNRI